MKFVFGPVPSRRLGQSLGIDTIPLKTCNWNCIYCQLGRTMPLTNERREYAPVEEILQEAETVLRSDKRREIDWVTFVGSGEPTLHSRIGQLIRSVKKMTALPVAVITNGSLLYLPEVRDDLCAADAVLPTLDAGTAELYRKINRPHPQVTFERLVNGLVEFRKAYSGKFWVEVMLIQGVNDSPEALQQIAKILKDIASDAVHINLPTRPPAEPWVQPPDPEGMMNALSILGEIAEVVHPAEGSFSPGENENIVDAVIAIITRHPMQQDELEKMLNTWSPDKAEETLNALKASGRAQVVKRYGRDFWLAEPSHFPKEKMI